MLDVQLLGCNLCNAFVVASVTTLCQSYIILINGLRQLPPRSRPKRREYQYGRQNATWIQTSSFTSTLGGQQMAPNVPVSCRECLHMPKSWDAKNVNTLSVEAASNQSLGQMPK